MKYLLAILSFVLIACAQAEPADAQAEQLVFGLYANERPSLLVKEFRPILDRLEQELSTRRGHKVTIKIDIAITYQEGINRLVKGDVDFARFGPASYILARKRNPDLQLIAVETKRGQTTFKGVICTQPNSSIASLEDLHMRSFAFGSRSSTIGRYFAQHALQSAGINEKDLSDYDYLGRHDRVGLAIAARQYDAGALKESTYKRLKKQGSPLRVIHTFNEVPTKPWIASSKLDKDTVQLITNSLISIDYPALTKGPYVKVPNETAHFKSIQTAINGSRGFLAFE